MSRMEFEIEIAAAQKHARKPVAGHTCTHGAVASLDTLPALGPQQVRLSSLSMRSGPRAVLRELAQKWRRAWRCSQGASRTKLSTPLLHPPSITIVKMDLAHAENAAAPRRKARPRATTACSTCRSRRTRCDNRKPSCGFCRNHGLSCHYDEVAQQPRSRYTNLLYALLDTLTRCTVSRSN